MDAKKVMPKNKTGKADMALNFIQKPYRIEQLPCVLGKR